MSVLHTFVCVCVCVCVRARARVRACACVRVRVRACVYLSRALSLSRFLSVCVCVCFSLTPRPSPVPGSSSIPPDRLSPVAVMTSDESVKVNVTGLGLTAAQSMEIHVRRSIPSSPSLLPIRILSVPLTPPAPTLCASLLRV